MADTMLERLIDERDNRQALIENVQNAAVETSRDLSDQDLETIKLARTRIDEIDRQVDVIGQDYAMDDAVRLRLSRLHPGQVQAPLPAYKYAGELFYDILHRGSNRQAADRLDKMMTRAAQHMGTLAADTTATAGDLAGLVVDPLRGPMIDFIPANRPFLSAIGVQPANAEHFYRPRLVDAALAAGSEVLQGSQKAELNSYAFSVARDTLDLTTYGNYLNISQQLLSFQPESLQIIVTQLSKRIARASEVAAVTEMATSTSKVTLTTTTTDAAVILKAIYDGNAKVYAETGEPATWIAMGPTGLARLGSLTDLAGRPMFPTLGPANAPGTASTQGMGSVAGLNAVQTYAISDLNYWVGNASALEAYEYRFPLLESIEPSVLGRQVAAAAAYAFYRPWTLSSTVTVGGLGAVHLAP